MENQFIQVARDKANGTSFFGTTIRTTANKLKEVFGNCYGASSDGKTNHEWILGFFDGVERIITIYDYKEYREFNDDEYIYWHIGGFSEESTEKAKKMIEALI